MSKVVFVCVLVGGCYCSLMLLLLSDTILEFLRAGLRPALFLNEQCRLLQKAVRTRGFLIFLICRLLEKIEKLENCRFLWFSCFFLSGALQSSGFLQEISISLRNGLQPASQTEGFSNFSNLQDIRKIRKIRKSVGFLAFS